MRKQMRRLAMALCVGLAPHAALSQPAPGGEFRVNLATAVNQQHPEVARQFGPPGPGFIVVWEDGADFVTVTDIYAAVFNDFGIRQVTDFRVNTYTTSFQTNPTVAGASDGTFTVAWESKAQNESSYGIYAQRSSSAGGPMGSEFLVSTYTTGTQRHPVIAPGTGSTRVVFEGNGVGDADGVFVSTPTGAPGALVNATTGLSQLSPSVSASISLGPGFSDYLVVWGGYGPASEQGIFGRIFDSSGLGIGPQFRINTTTAGDQTAPSVAGSLYSVCYIVVWESPNGAGLRDVFAQRVESDGTPRGPEFRVNTHTTGNQDQPSVAVDDLGNFVVVWSSYQDGSQRSVHAQAFDNKGVPRGGEFRLNSFITNDQRMPSVAATGGRAGKFVVVWQSFAQESSTSNEGIYARLFDFPYPHGDANGDGAVDVGDVFHLINFLFSGGPVPTGYGDANGDGLEDVADVFYLINYLFAGGPPPV